MKYPHKRRLAAVRFIIRYVYDLKAFYCLLPLKTRHQHVTWSSRTKLKKSIVNVKWTCCLMLRILVDLRKV